MGKCLKIIAIVSSGDVACLEQSQVSAGEQDNVISPSSCTKIDPEFIYQESEALGKTHYLFDYCVYSQQLNAFKAEKNIKRLENIPTTTTFAQIVTPGPRGKGQGEGGG